MFEYKCMHLFSKTKCIFKYKCMHVYARGYGSGVLSSVLMFNIKFSTPLKFSGYRDLQLQEGENYSC